MITLHCNNEDNFNQTFNKTPITDRLKKTTKVKNLDIKINNNKNHN